VKTVKVYKVVHVKDGRRYSVMVYMRPKMRVEYKPGRWAKPQIKGSALYAARSLRWDAGMCAPHEEVWEAEAVLWRGRQVPWAGEYYAPLSQVRAWWRKVGRGEEPRQRVRAPDAVWCKRIKLVKRVV
jgi:hypothetical protein